MILTIREQKIMYHSLVERRFNYGICVGTIK